MKSWDRTRAWAGRVGALLLASAAVTGCGTVGGNTYQLSRDVYELNRKLEESLERQQATDNKVTYALTSLDENMQARNEMMQQVISDIETRMRQQLQEMEKLRQNVESLTVAVDSLSRRLNLDSGLRPGGGLTDSFGNGTTQPTPTTPTPSLPGETRTSPGTSADTLRPQPVSDGGAAGQLYNTALNHYQSGDYARAREGFLRALEQDPDPETRVEVLFWLAESSRLLGDNDTAWDHYWDLIQLNPSHAKSWVALERMGQIELQRGNLSEAKEILQQIVDTYPAYPQIDRVNRMLQQIQQQQSTSN